MSRATRITCVMLPILLLHSERLQQMTEIVLRINRYLGYDFNTVELAVRNGVPYAIDFCNPHLMRKEQAWVKKISNGWSKRLPTTH
jgi:hypothetical protein